MEPLTNDNETISITGGLKTDPNLATAGREIIEEYGNKNSPIAKDISSPNYKEDTAGWRLRSNGDAEFNQGIAGFFSLLGSATRTDASNGTFTVDAGDDVVTSNNHSLIGGDTVELTTTGTLPAGLALTTKYYVLYLTANTFQLSLTPFDTDVDITGTGTGTHTWTNKFGSMVVSFTPKTHLKVVIFAPTLTSASVLGLNFNTAGGADYGTAYVSDGAVAVQVNSFTQVELDLEPSTDLHYFTADIINMAAHPKAGNFAYNIGGVGSAGGAIQSGTFVWNNTTEQISQINAVFYDTTRAGFGTGSKIYVFGTD